MFLLLVVASILAMLALAVFASKRGITIKWYESVLGAGAIFLILFAVAEYFAALEEFEPLAANALLLIFGLSGVVLGLIAGALVWNRKRNNVTA